MEYVMTNDPPEAPQRVDLKRVARVVVLLVVLYVIIWTTATVSFHRGKVTECRQIATDTSVPCRLR